MKFSIYNTRLNLSQRTDIIFNAVTSDSVIVPKDLSLDISSLNPKMIKLFLEKGILVNKDKDESEEIWHTFCNSATSEDAFFLTVNPTLMCNFRCWYCYESHKPHTVMSNDVILRVKAYLSNLSRKFNRIELSFFGGEPLLQFDNVVIPICEHLRSISESKGVSYSISFTTNGFLLTDAMISNLKRYDIGLLQITLDGNEEAHNKVRVSNFSNSFRTIVANIHQLVREHIFVLLRVNVTSKNIEGALDIPRYFEDFTSDEKKCVNVVVQQVWQDYANDLLDEIWDLYSCFHKRGIMPWPRKFNFIKDICYADKLNSAIINYNGHIYKCTAMDFDTTQSEGVLTQDGGYDPTNSFYHRMHCRKSNSICEICRIRPVCNGGCFKQLVKNEGKTSFCIHPAEEDKDKVIRDIIKQQLYMTELGISWK